MTVTTCDHHQMLTVYYGNGYNCSIDNPSPTILTRDRCALVTAHFMDNQYGCSKTTSIDQPNGTLTANPKQNLLGCKWLIGNVGQNLNAPCRTITANRKHFYLMNPQFNCKGSSIEKPCFTLIARMDKMPPYLMQTINGEMKIKINPEDTETMVRLKKICNDNGIIDILMRMLFIQELKRIMGFGDDYILKGTKAEMKKFIGNAVETTQAKVLAESIAMTIYKNLIKQAV